MANSSERCEQSVPVESAGLGQCPAGLLVGLHEGADDLGGKCLCEGPENDCQVPLGGIETLALCGLKGNDGVDDHRALHYGRSMGPHPIVCRRNAREGLFDGFTADALVRRWVGLTRGERRPDVGDLVWSLRFDTRFWRPLMQDREGPSHCPHQWEWVLRELAIGRPAVQPQTLKLIQQ